MQLLCTASPRRGTDVPSPETQAAPTVAQTAAKWAGIALDPRPTAKLLGRSGAAVATLALQARGAAARTLYVPHDLQSPTTGSHYAIRAAANEDKAYFNRLLNKCQAVAVNAGDPAKWNEIAHWGNTLLLRELNATSPGDEAFEACLIREGHAQSRVIPRRAGIIAGSVIGGVLVGTALVLGGLGIYRHFKGKTAAPNLEVEMSGPALR